MSINLDQILIRFLILVHQSLDKTLSGIKKIIQRNVDTGRISQVKADQHLSLLQGTLDYNDLKGSDIVIEAVYESMDLKKQIFERLDQVCKPETILASNTSGLNIDEVGVTMCHEYYN